MLHESDNSDQIKKMFDDKICIYVSANNYEPTRLIRTYESSERHVEYAIAINKIQLSSTSPSIKTGRAGIFLCRATFVEQSAS